MTHAPAHRIIRLLPWEQARNEALAVRLEVFVREQGVPPEMEVDEFDPLCLHAIAGLSAGRVLATGRVLLPRQAGEPARIGRMAVLSRARGRGLGRLLLDTLISRARDADARSVVLHAQTHALGFYARAGFAAHGPEFDDAGIPHREMRLETGPRNASLSPGAE